MGYLIQRLDLASSVRGGVQRDGMLRRGVWPEESTKADYQEMTHDGNSWELFFEERAETLHYPTTDPLLVEKSIDTKLQICR